MTRMNTLELAAAIGFVVGFSLRGGALLWGWSLPGFRARAGEPPPHS